MFIDIYLLYDIVRELFIFIWLNSFQFHCYLTDLNCNIFICFCLNLVLMIQLLAYSKNPSAHKRRWCYIWFTMIFVRMSWYIILLAFHFYAVWSLHTDCRRRIFVTINERVVFSFSFVDLVMITSIIYK